MERAAGDGHAAAIPCARAYVPVRGAAWAAGVIAASGLVLVACAFGMREGAFLASLPAGLALAAVASFVAARFAFESPRMPLRGCVITRAGIVSPRGAYLLAARDVRGIEIETTRRGRILRVFDRRLDLHVIRPARDEDVEPASALLGGGRGVVAVRAQPLATPYEALFALLAVVGSVFLTLASWGPVIVPLAVVVLFLVLAGTPTRVVAGDDAVHLRWLARRVTLPVSTITRAAANATGATLEAEGRTHVFSMPPAAARGFALRVAAALEAMRAAQRSELEARLARGARSLDAWIADLRELASDRATYRVATAPRDALLAVALDVGRPPLVRIAVATAFADVDPPTRAALSEAGRATADPELRRALEQAARGEPVDARLLEQVARRR